MKRWIIPLLVGTVALGTLVLAQPKVAGAWTREINTFGYCSTSQVPPGYGSGTGYEGVFGSTGMYWKGTGNPQSLPNDSVTQLLGKGQKALTASGLPQARCAGPQAHAYVLPGDTWYPSWLLVLNHDDISGYIWYLVGSGAFAAAGFLCQQVIPLPAFVSVPICTAGVLIVGALFNQYVTAAIQQVGYEVDYGCAPYQPVWCPTTDVYNPILGVYDTPVHQAGVNVLFAFPAFPVGLQVNPTP